MEDPQQRKGIMLGDGGGVVDEERPQETRINR